MQSLICMEPGVLIYKEIPPPVLTPGQAIVRIKRVGICGTDLHAFEGTQPFFTYPRILGHELAADLIEYDQTSGIENKQLKPGDLVGILPYLSCGVCIACRNGKPNCCANLKVCGVHADGGMVDYLSVPIECLIPSQGLPYEALAMLEPLAIGAHAVRRAGLYEGEFVLIVGAGPIGLAAMVFARLAGARVIAMDIIESRLQFCLEKQKADFAIPGKAENLKERLMEITAGDMPTTVMDATGNRGAINKGFEYIAHGGKYILIGLQKEEIYLSHPEFHKREATLMSSRNSTIEDFNMVIDCIIEGRIRVSDFITHTLRFEELKEAFPDWLNPSCGVIKAMVKMD
jgi:2-desacetyl-2-hydroxyethyl bacteriochlorophyllide A dehydrogenase